MIGVIELTELRKLDGGLLTKRISLGDDGKLKSDGSACRLVVGMARRMVMNGSNPAGTLADRLNGMGSHVALTLGQMSAAVGDECHIASRKELAACAEWVGDVITRTLDYFSFSKGPGWAVVDFDRKGMPASVQARLAELGGFQAALRSLIAGLDGVAIVTRGSSSDGIRNTETGERYEGSGGLHVYILLAVQGDMPRLLKALHQRAMLAGLGWVMVGTAGQLLERSIIDTAVGSPERLVFEGTPEVLSPLQQDQTKRRAVASKATAPLDSRVAVPDLTLAERREYDRLVNVERARLKPEAEARLKREGAKRGPDGERILREAVTKQILSGSMQLQFDTLGTVTVDAIMTDPARYNGATLADPIEGVAYGTGKAKLFINDDGSVIVHSFAHGERIFRLRYSVAGVRAALEQAGKDARKIYIGLLLGAKLDQADEEQIIGLVSQLTGSGRQALKADLKAARSAAARERRVAEHTAPDGRVTRLAPAADAERSPIVADLEAILRQESPPTVFKDIAGEVVRVVLRPSALFHLLTSATADGGVHADMFAPPPASPQITAHTVDSMREVLEQRICYLHHTKNETREVTLPDSFIRAFLAPRLSSTLPLLTDISDVPVVTPNGNVIVASGHHAETCIFFTCTEAEAKAVVPDDVVPDDDAVRRAYRIFADEMFADVAFADPHQGLAAAVAFLLTLMNVPVLPEKPAINFTAPLRASGKTTAINMIYRTVTRRSAPAAAWSTNPEERRKTLFAVAREGHPAVTFDNIMRGTTIRCAHIERFSTSAEVSDRVLSESRTETVRTPLVVVNGNAIVMGGDLGSRTLTIELKAAQTDPENREFKHPDILGWCDRNRTRLLKAALTILLGNPTLHQKVKPQTRFKAWHVLVGSAVEHAAALAKMPAEMTALFAKSESEDEVTGVLADLVELLRQAFPEGEFTIEDLTKLLNHPMDGVLLLEAVNSLGGQPLRLVTAKTVGPVLVRYVKGRPIAGADGDTWTIAPRKRTSGKQKIVWEISGRKAGYSGSL